MTITLDSLRTQGMRILFGASVLMALCIFLLDVVKRDQPNAFFASGLALLLLIYPFQFFRSARTDGEARISMSMVTCAMPILLLFVARGEIWQTDLHMVFFAGLAMTAILCDWRAVMASTLVVAVHHLGFGLLLPDWVFYGGGSFGRILLHAVVLLSEAVVLVWICHQIIGLLAAIDKEQVERRAVEAEVASERAERVTELQQAMSELSRSLTGLRNGCLTGDLSPGFPQRLGQIRSDYNAALGSLRSLVRGVSESAHQIHQSASEIAGASNDLAARSQTNAASLEETNAAIEQIDLRLKASAKSSANTLSEAGTALARVAEGKRKLGDAVQAITSVSEAAKAISAVMEGLDSISFQTRVLAMNIAIEANRAGEAGAGFAVVAELVGQLAKRSEEESRNARTYITTTQDSIAAATHLVLGLASSFEEVTRAVTTVNGLVEAMAGDNQAQSLAVSEIATALAVMDRSVQQTAAMVEQSSAACQMLSDEADMLAERSGAFETGDERALPRALAA